MWVLVVSGFAGTGLDSGGVEADPSGPKFLATTGRVVLIQWGEPPDKSNTDRDAVLRQMLLPDIRAASGSELFVFQQNSAPITMGGAAAWAGWAMAHPKFWLGGPQCIWPHQ